MNQQCKFYAKGQCKFGTKCQFRHDNAPVNSNEYNNHPTNFQNSNNRSNTNQPANKIWNRWVDDSSSDEDAKLNQGFPKKQPRENLNSNQQPSKPYWQYNPKNNNPGYKPSQNNFIKNPQSYANSSQTKMNNISNPRVPQNHASNVSSSLQPYFGIQVKPIYKFEIMELDEKTFRRLPEDPYDCLSVLKKEHAIELLCEYQVYVLSLEFGSIFSFCPLNFKVPNFTIPGIPKYSYEEIRLAFYISSYSPELMEIYRYFMDVSKQDFKKTLKILKSHDLVGIYKNHKKINWPHPTRCLDSVLSNYFEDFNKDEPLFKSIFENFSYKHPHEIKELAENPGSVNMWYCDPIILPPLTHKVVLTDPILNIPNPKDFPTIASPIPHFFFLNQLLDNPIGPYMYQQNSRSTKFDGAYSYNDSISQDEQDLFCASVFTRFGLPTYPPSRKLVIS